MIIQRCRACFQKIFDFCPSSSFFFVPPCQSVNGCDKQWMPLWTKTNWQQRNNVTNESETDRSWQNSQGEVQIFFTAAVVVVNQSFTVRGPAQVLKTQLIYFGSVESWSCSYGQFSWILDESHCARWEIYLSLNFSEMVIWNWTRSVIYKSG